MFQVYLDKIVEKHSKTGMKFAYIFEKLIMGYEEKM